MRQPRDGDTRVRNEIGPMISLVVNDNLLHEPFLKIIQFAARFGFLLHGGEQPSFEFRVPRFDFSRYLPPIRRGAGMSKPNDNCGDDA